MLVGSCVEDHLRTPFAEGVVQAGWKADVTDDRDECQIRELFFEFEAEIVHWGLCVVIEHEFLDAEGSQLAAKLGSDGACCSCHHHSLALEVGYDLVHGDLDLGTHEKVLDLDVSECMGRLAVHHLVDRRSEEHLDAAVDRILDHAVFLYACLFFCSEEDCVCVNVFNSRVKLLFSIDVINLQF